MVNWFFENFEDPAYRTPYESAEGGYIWIWGGPYNAADQIGSNFPDEGQELIDAAVERVEQDGIVDWAPTDRPGDYDPEPDEPEDGPKSEEALAETEVEPDRPLFDLEEILATIPTEASGPLFDRTAQERVDLIDWAGAAAPDGALLTALRELAADLLSQLEGTNGHQDLLHAVSRYATTVNATPVSVPSLYIGGVFLENTIAECDREIAVGDRPPLPSMVSGRLASLRDLHGTLIMSTPTGLAMIDAADRYRAKPDDRDRLTQSILEVAHAIRDTSAVFGPTARQLADVAASNVDKGDQPQRSNHAASLLLKSMLAGAGKLLRFVVHAGILTIVGDGLAATGAGRMPWTASRPWAMLLGAF